MLFQFSPRSKSFGWRRPRVARGSAIVADYGAIEILLDSLPRILSIYGARRLSSRRLAQDISAWVEISRYI